MNAVDAISLRVLRDPRHPCYGETLREVVADAFARRLGPGGIEEALEAIRVSTLQLSNTLARGLEWVGGEREHADLTHLFQQTTIDEVLLRCARDRALGQPAFLPLHGTDADGVWRVGVMVEERAFVLVGDAGSDAADASLYRAAVSTEAHRKLFNEGYCINTPERWRVDEGRFAPVSKVGHNQWQVDASAEAVDWSALTGREVPGYALATRQRAMGL